MDVVVEEAVILEVKTVDRLISIHDAQLLSYQKDEWVASWPVDEFPRAGVKKRPQTYCQQLLRSSASLRLGGEVFYANSRNSHSPRAELLERLLEKAHHHAPRYRGL